MSNYTWTIPVGGTITSGGGVNDNTATVTWSVAGNRTITVNYQNSFGCSATSAKVYNVTVSQTPFQPTVVGQEICTGGIATLTAYNATSGQKYLWYDTATGGTLLKTSTDYLDNTYTTGAINTNTTFWASILNANGCEGPRSTGAVVTAITVNAGTISASKTIFCEGENPPAFINNVPASGNFGTTEYQWQRSTDGSSFSPVAVSGTNATYDPPVLPVGNYWYRRAARVKYQGSNYCTVYTNEIKLEVYPVPVITSVTSNSPICWGDQNDPLAIPLTINVSAANASGNVTFTLHYESGSYAMKSLSNPADETQTVASSGGSATTSFAIYPEVGRQTYSVTAVNGDLGGCVSEKDEIEVKIFAHPEVDVLASCASGASGVVRVYGQIDNANFVAGSGDYGEVEYNIDIFPDYWSNDDVWYNVPPGTYTLSARSTAANNPSCDISGVIELKDQTITGGGLSVCQDYEMTDDDFLSATSFCFTWSLDVHNLKKYPTVCTDNDQDVYIPASPATSTFENYSPAASSSKFARLITFRMPDGGEVNLKDATNKPDGTVSLYKYPFNPDYPDRNFVEAFTLKHTGTGNNFTNLITDVIYVLVINQTGSQNPMCMNGWLVTGDRIDVIDDIATVNWYLNEDDGTPIYSGEIWDPVGYPGSGVPDTDTPGVYTFYAGCGTADECRQPIQLFINPYPVVVAQKDTICSGTTTSFALSARANTAPFDIIDPALFDIVFEWEAVPNSEITGWSDGSGAILAQTLTAVSPAVCPIMVYNVRASAGGCWAGDITQIEVMVLDNTNQTLPGNPDPLTVTCITDVPPADEGVLSNGCFNLTAIPVDTDNGGAGCPDDRLIITRTWNFDDGCNPIILTQQITVIDDVAPTFTVPVDIEIFTDANCFANINPANTGDVTDEDDNCSTDLEATFEDAEEIICVGSKKITRTWTITDDCGNETSQEQIIWVTDNIAPIVQTPVGALDATFDCEQAAEIAAVLLLTPVATDNCSDAAHITMNLISDNTTYVDLACPNNYTRVRTWTFTDDCTNESLPFTQTIQVVDPDPPVLANPPSAEYCVVDILEATYDGQPEPDADIIASNNPLYEPSPDVLGDRPDYYIFDKTNTDLDLDPATYFSDNCTDPDDIVLHWSITNSSNQPVLAHDGSILTDITGQVSAFLTAQNTTIKFTGAEAADVTYIITYWLVDLCGNTSEVKTAEIIIKPRPQIIKLTNN